MKGYNYQTQATSPVQRGKWGSKGHEVSLIGQYSWLTVNFSDMTSHFCTLKSYDLLLITMELKARYKFWIATVLFPFCKHLP